MEAIDGMGDHLLWKPANYPDSGEKIRPCLIGRFPASLRRAGQLKRQTGALVWQKLQVAECSYER
jgi:hypothetical protein